MAGIDKTYLRSWEQYEQLRDWCEGKEYTLNNGIKIKPSDFIRWEFKDGYAKEIFKVHEGNPDFEYPVWATPECLDMFLYKDCPLDFIQEYLHSAYNDIEEYYQEWINWERPEPCTHFTISKKPNFNCRKNPIKFKHKLKMPWVIHIENEGGLAYDDVADTWFYPYKEGSIAPWITSSAEIQNFNIRKFTRKFMKWKLPAGLIINIQGPYVGQEYVIKTRK